MCPTRQGHGAPPLVRAPLCGFGDPPADPGKCERDIYKRLLRQTIQSAGQPILTNEMEYAPDLVLAMDLFRAGKNQASLRHFIDEIRKALQSLA